jgi:hypothetical protein
MKMSTHDVLVQSAAGRDKQIFDALFVGCDSVDGALTARLSGDQQRDVLLLEPGQNFCARKLPASPEGRECRRKLASPFNVVDGGRMGNWGQALRFPAF